MFGSKPAGKANPLNSGKRLKNWELDNIMLDFGISDQL